MEREGRGEEGRKDAYALIEKRVLYPVRHVCRCMFIHYIGTLLWRVITALLHLVATGTTLVKLASHK